MQVLKRRPETARLAELSLLFLVHGQTDNTPELSGNSSVPRKILSPLLKFCLRWHHIFTCQRQ